MALTSVAKRTSSRESLLQEILQQINKKQEELLKELKLLNEIETELKSTTLYTVVADKPQSPIKKNKKQDIQDAVRRAAAWSKERKARKSK